MWKNFLKIIAFLILLFSVIDITFAYSCKFTGDINAESDWWNSIVGADGYFVVDINPNNNTITPNSGDVNEIIDPYIDSSWTYERIIEKLNGNCPDKVLFCKLKGTHGTYGQFLVMNDTLEAKLVENKKVSIPRKTFLGTAHLTYEYKDSSSCVWFTYSKDGSSAGDSSVVYDCDEYGQYISELDKYFKADKTKYKEVKRQAKIYCGSVFENLDASNSCAKECLLLNDYITELESTGNSSNVCGFSQRLINWIINILKWIKYIVPVLVIVLGALDFIKAVGADKDDELKKAQGRLIKRLVAAALIFIVPLILEFVLTKMGLGYNDCGLF